MTKFKVQTYILSKPLIRLVATNVRLGYLHNYDEPDCYFWLGLNTFSEVLHNHLLFIKLFLKFITSLLIYLSLTIYTILTIYSSLTMHILTRFGSFLLRRCVSVNDLCALIIRLWSLVSSNCKNVRCLWSWSLIALIIVFD